MPLLKIVTNVSKGKIPVDFVEKAVPVLAAALGKEPEKFMVTISGDTPLCFARDAARPGAVASLESIGALGAERNHIIVRALADLLKREIGVAPDRFVISFYDMQPWNIGVNGTTVDRL